MSIEPDTKDWTWVLRQRCPECGAQVGALRREVIAPMLRAAGAVWFDVLSNGGDELRRRPRPGVWSVGEYGCHARDVNRAFVIRLSKIRDEDDPVFANWDQDAFAIEDGYAAQDPGVVGTEIVEAGEELAEAFEGLTDGEWSRVGRRSDGAVFTAESLGRYLMHDVLHHLWDIGRPPPADGVGNDD